MALPTAELKKAGCELIIEIGRRPHYTTLAPLGAACG